MTYESLNYFWGIGNGFFFSFFKEKANHLNRLNIPSESLSFLLPFPLPLPTTSNHF